MPSKPRAIANIVLMLVQCWTNIVHLVERLLQSYSVISFIFIHERLNDNLGSRLQSEIAYFVLDFFTQSKRSRSLGLPYFH